MTTMRSQARAAVAIVVDAPDGERFLTGITRVRRGGAGFKIARVQTAWSLAGARLFLHGNAELDRWVRALAEDGRKFRTVDVVMVEP